MAETRLEKDSLGVVEVPASAMYGAQTQRAVENYPISGMRASKFLIRAIGMVKKAAAEANGELGVVSKERAEAIARAAEEVIEGKWDKEFVVDVFQAGAGVSFHMNANEVISNRANQLIAAERFEVQGSRLEARTKKLGGSTTTTTEILRVAQNDDANGDDDREEGVREAERAALGKYEWVHPNDHVNYGQSTNDVFPTAMRLGALLALEGLYPVLDSLAEGFAIKAKEFDGVVKAGRTHMQDATPIRLGQEFAAYSAATRRAKVLIQRGAESLRELGLGGSAVGTGINTHPEYRVLAIAKLAAISRQRLEPAADMRWAMQSCGPMAEVSAALRGLALEVIRIANDLRLMSSGPNTGFNEIALPSLQPGSSIMPGKINPVLAELAAMVGFQVVGNDMAVAIAKLAAISRQRLEPAADMRWAMQSCGPMAEVSATLRGLALEVIRIANDLRLMSSGPNTGFNEIALPSLQPGSSIMPGKINPVLAELAAMVGFQVVGNDMAVAMAVQAGQLELNVMMPTMAYNVLQSVEILTNALRELDTRCVRGITANVARCEFYAQSTVALATALNPYIGYAKAAELVKESIASGRSVIEVAREKGVLSEMQIREILDVGKMTGE